MSRKARHASVLTMNPGGTGRPIPAISARFAPLPPSRSLRSLFPSANAYTYFDILSSRKRSAGALVRFRAVVGSL